MPPQEIGLNVSNSFQQNNNQVDFHIENCNPKPETGEKDVFSSPGEKS